VISLPEDHANPAINLSERKKDLYNLFQNKETSKKEKEYLLKKYDSKYLLVFNWELKDFEGVSNLNTIRQDGQMTLFEVTN
jgi:hypothetical protein